MPKQQKFKFEISVKAKKKSGYTQEEYAKQIVGDMVEAANQQGNYKAHKIKAAFRRDLLRFKVKFQRKKVTHRYNYLASQFNSNTKKLLTIFEQCCGCKSPLLRALIDNSF